MRQLALPSHAALTNASAQPRTHAAMRMLPEDVDDAQLIELWLHGHAVNTKAAYRVDIATLRRYCPLPFGQMTLAHLQAFTDSLSVVLAPASQARRIRAVKSLFSFAQKTGYLPLNIGAALRVPPVEDQRAERILSEEQVQRMLALTERPRDHALLRLLYAAGLRVSEVVSLTWSHLQPRSDGRGQVSVFGKGGKTRSVLISAATYQELMVLRGTAPADRPVFASRGGNHHRGGDHLDRSQVLRLVKAAATRAGIEAHVSPHWLRHAHASHALDRGAPLSLV